MPPKPFRLPDTFWEPTPLQALQRSLPPHLCMAAAHGRHCCQAQLAKEKITFRDLDIIQHFLADNGCANAKDYICPCWFSFHSSEVHPATTDDHAVSEEAEGCSAIRAS